MMKKKNSVKKLMDSVNGIDFDNAGKVVAMRGKGKAKDFKKRKY